MPVICLVFLEYIAFNAELTADTVAVVVTKNRLYTYQQVYAYETAVIEATSCTYCQRIYECFVLSFIFEYCLILDTPGIKEQVDV